MPELADLGHVSATIFARSFLANPEPDCSRLGGAQNSLLAGKIQGILFVWASEGGYWLGMQCVGDVLRARHKLGEPLLGRLLSNSGHEIHKERPQLVIDGWGLIPCGSTPAQR
jgi:hypothetical protein